MNEGHPLWEKGYTLRTKVAAVKSQITIATETVLSDPNIPQGLKDWVKGVNQALALIEQYAKFAMER